MSQEDEKVLEIDQEPNLDQPEEELELEVTPAEGGTQDGDPLDSIQDVDELRAEAKKHRAIAQRHKDKPPVETKPVEETPKVEVPTGDYLKKSDFERANQKKAILMATIINESDSEDVQSMKAELVENWEEIRQYYTPRKGKDTPEGILEDIKDAHTLYSSKKVVTEDKPDNSDLSETKVDVVGGTKKAKTTKKNPLDDRIRSKSNPDEWYE